LGKFSAEQPENEWERPSGVLNVFEAAPRPVWSTEAPTHPGWFWLRPEDRDSGIPVRVIRDPDSGALVWGGLPTFPWRSVRVAGLLWSDRAIVECVGTSL
jgi:hypothetical protein